ncbi:hypothetical protein HHK36_029804 [Tetracentron sinense]|uniref:Bifunctional inhibitor/plant lipid transfer protein/seed storage helical domain-containing protein n=1 Tax=Tetracentron sinense TaxID=13715 RepID=A0A834YCC0_TETSI|nr:hypothetical protein HHK36_029804 [Tetracentron sinense]
MYSPSISSSYLAIFSLVPLFLIWLPCPSSQTEDIDLSFSGTNMVQCGPRLLLLTPCAPFVQGSVPSPAQPCCNNLLNIYSQQPNCLCILLNDTAMGYFPINKTLALQLPVLCHLQVNISTCPGLILPPTSPESQVPFVSNASSSAAASPTIILAPMAPRSNIMGYGFGRSTGVKLKIEAASLVMAATPAALMLIEALSRL